MTDPTALLQLAIATAIIAVAVGWTSLARSQAHERKVTTLRTVGKIRRDRNVRELRHRARRWYRWAGRLELIGFEWALSWSTVCKMRGGRLWRDMKDLEREPADAYAYRALPFTTRR